MYKITINTKKYIHKPEKDEIREINNNLTETELPYKELAVLVGEQGCTFAPAVFNGRRKQDNFREQQLIALDFDNGISFNNIKKKAERYGLEILFAYKTFSWTPENEKFRIVFALSMVMSDIFTAKVMIEIFIKLFPECDRACRDASRMFFGGTGLLTLSEENKSTDPYMLFTIFNTIMADTYGERHYNDKIRNFYRENSVAITKGKNTPEIVENNNGGKCTFTIIYNGCCTKSPRSGGIDNVPTLIFQSRRKVARNFSWDTLYENCQLFRNFCDGEEYYYYPELFHIATNLCNIEKGKKVFLDILYSFQNIYYTAYHERNWAAVLNTIIKSDYKPQGCEKCPYNENCHHLKNMIRTAKPLSREIRKVKEEKYVSIEAAEESLRKNFSQAVEADDKDVHIIKAQTGIGKTHLYLNYLKTAEEPYIIAVPTHALKNEVYEKAIAMGIVNIVATPEMPKFSDKLMNKINRLYSTGAGALALTYLKMLAGSMDKDDEDYEKLTDFLEKSNAINYSGHIITTHERFLRIQHDSETLKSHRIIIDEDILRTVYSTNMVSVDDVKKLAESNILNQKARKRLHDILSSKGYRKYHSPVLMKLDIETADRLENINGNVLDLLSSEQIYVHNDNVYFINKKNIPNEKLIVLSATAVADIYRLFLRNRIVTEYRCKQAKYRGKVIQYTNYTYSRCCMRNSENAMKFLKSEVGDDTVITFKEFENTFNTSYHYGNTEGVNCLEGKNISVIGMPNISDIVYRLYGMIAGISPDEHTMYPMRIEHNGYDFSMCTFNNDTLRTIQLWLIESLLEQAVGRARLLRYDCTVKVFAGFPVGQCG